MNAIILDSSIVIEEVRIGSYIFQQAMLFMSQAKT